MSVPTLPTPLAAPVYVSRPVLPDREAFAEQIAPLWDSHMLTNLGPMHEQLTEAVAERLGGSVHVSLWNNGTTALIAALTQLDLSGEVIVTPFTFPATVQAIALLGLTPVFADIDPVTMTISPEAIEAAVTEATSAIVGTHIYGIPCDTEAIDAIARRHDLRVVYDGAHSFGRIPPVFPQEPHALGDVTMLSFHATKLFHTVEGGALITPHADLDLRLHRARNFGFVGEDLVEGVALNGKMSELHAAMGLMVLPLIDEEIAARGALADEYASRLAGVPGIRIVSGLGDSKQYFVIRVDAEEFGATRDELHLTLRSLNVISRRYFYPLCSDVEPYASLPSAEHLPAARAAADECLALPFHSGVDEAVVETVAAAVAWQSRRAEAA